MKVSTPNRAIICSLSLMLSFYLFSSVAAIAAPTGTGEGIYQFHCAQCHGVKADGKGVNATEDLPTAPKDFTSPKTLPVFTDEQIVKTIVNGGPAVQLSFIMPSWAEILSDEEVELLRAYLRKTCNCQYDPEAAAKAKAEAEKNK